VQIHDSQRAIRLIVNVVAEISSRFISLSQSNTSIQRKNDGSVVTELDTWAEDLLYSEVRQHFPEALVVCEERQSMGNSCPLNFKDKPHSVIAIDPLDGTENYVQGLPFYGISIGAMSTESKVSDPAWGILALPALGKIIFNCSESFFVYDMHSKVESRLTFAESSSAWLVPRWFYGDWGTDPQALRTTGSSVFDLYHVVRGAAACTFSRACLWDLLGGLAMGASLEIGLFCMESGEELSLFSTTTFSNENYRLTCPAIICRKRNTAQILAQLKSRRDANSNIS
jgi:fructose-1,6-bisphosphatase/inositol monophosphatase family enzyme